MSLSSSDDSLITKKGNMSEEKLYYLYDGISIKIPYPCTRKKNVLYIEYGKRNWACPGPFFFYASSLGNSLYPYPFTLLPLLRNFPLITSNAGLLFLLFIQNLAIGYAVRSAI